MQGSVQLLSCRARQHGTTACLRALPLSCSACVGSRRAASAQGAGVCRHCCSKAAPSRAVVGSAGLWCCGSAAGHCCLLSVRLATYYRCLLGGGGGVEHCVIGALDAGCVPGVPGVEYGCCLQPGGCMVQFIASFLVAPLAAAGGRLPCWRMQCCWLGAGGGVKLIS
jgi:hypothetical protein